MAMNLMHQLERSSMTSFVSTVKSTVKNDGVLGLYRGFPFSMTGVFLYRLCEKLMNPTLEPFDSRNVWVCTTAGHHFSGFMTLSRSWPPRAIGMYILRLSRPRSLQLARAWRPTPLTQSGGIWWCRRWINWNLKYGVHKNWWFWPF